MRISKKIKALMGVLCVSSLMLVGCSSTEDLSKDQNGEVTTQETQTNEGAVNVDSTNMSIESDEWNVNVLSVEKATDFEGNPVLKLVYNFENKSEEVKAPFTTVSFKAFQNGVELDSTPISDAVDLGLGQKEVLKGGKIEEAHQGFLLTDESEIILYVDDFMSFNNENQSEFKINVADLTISRTK